AQRRAPLHRCGVRVPGADVTEHAPAPRGIGGVLPEELLRPVLHEPAAALRAQRRAVDLQRGVQLAADLRIFPGVAAHDRAEKPRPRTACTHGRGLTLRLLLPG